jgi:hypothetical protein
MIFGPSLLPCLLVGRLRMNTEYAFLFMIMNSHSDINLILAFLGYLRAPRHSADGPIKEVWLVSAVCS